LGKSGETITRTPEGHSWVFIVGFMREQGDGGTKCGCLKKEHEKATSRFFHPQRKRRGGKSLAETAREKLKWLPRGEEVNQAKN